MAISSSSAGENPSEKAEQRRKWVLVFNFLVVCGIAGKGIWSEIQEVFKF